MGASRDTPAHFRRFFRELGYEIRACRQKRKLSQEDMISYGFSVRHWQMMEAGRPITACPFCRTMLRDALAGAPGASPALLDIAQLAAASIPPDAGALGHAAAE